MPDILITGLDYIAKTFHLDGYDWEIKAHAIGFLIYIVSISNDLDLARAEDIVLTAKREVEDCLNGESIYNTPEEVIEDYFSLGKMYAWAFI